MSERPFMQLYVSDFVGDTLLLSAEHIGVYLLLLIALWNADGELPRNDVKLARVARMPVETWRETWAELEQFFEVTETTIRHSRLSRELLKSAGKSLSRSEAGRKGGNAKALKDKNAGLAIAKPNAMASSRNHIEKEGAIALVPTERAVPASTKLDRYADAEVFAECERIRGKEAPMHQWSFANDIIDQARANIASKAKANAA